MAVLSDPISDFLTRLKNASLAGNEEFTAPCSNIKVEIARILQEEELAIMCAYQLMRYVSGSGDPLAFLEEP